MKKNTIDDRIKVIEQQWGQEKGNNDKLTQLLNHSNTKLVNLQGQHQALVSLRDEPGTPALSDKDKQNGNPIPKGKR